MAEYLVEAQEISGSNPRGGTKFYNMGLWRSWCARWFEGPGSIPGGLTKLKSGRHAKSGGSVTGRRCKMKHGKRVEVFRYAGDA